MIIDYKLTYPSGTATAVLINGFHTPKGDVMAKYVLILSFLFNFFGVFNLMNFLGAQTSSTSFPGSRFMDS